MKILALERELLGATVEQFRRFAKAEARAAWDLHQAGHIRELYFRADRHEAVLVLECESTDEAERFLASLPFVSQNLITFDLIPLVAYPGFERLFADGDE
jgi:muconolactone delta-isomerase